MRCGLKDNFPADSQNTLMFSTHGQMAHAALAWASGLGLFRTDHSKHSPSRLSITLQVNTRQRLAKVLNTLTSTL